LVGIPFGLAMMCLMFLGVEEEWAYLLMRITGLVLVFNLLTTRRI